MLSRSGRPLAAVLFGPIARACVKAHISADAITITGTVLGVAVALTTFPLGYLWQGAIAMAVLVIFDNLDGQIARLTKTASSWGAFLDSTLDRVSDAAIFAGILAWGYLHHPAGEGWLLAGALGALIMGSVVPYARARAEGLGMNASVGLAERADRLVVILAALFLQGLGLWDYFLHVGVWLLFITAAITVVQRMLFVRTQAQAGAGSDANK